MCKAIDLVGGFAFEFVSRLFLARALESVDDICTSLGSSACLVAWWYFSGGCVFDQSGDSSRVSS